MKTGIVRAYFRQKEALLLAYILRYITSTIYQGLAAVDRTLLILRISSRIRTFIPYIVGAQHGNIVVNRFVILLVEKIT